MQIDRVVFRGLKALVNRDDRFVDEPDAPPAKSVCIRGLNGSGKTTYLAAIAAMWSKFREWSQRGVHVKTQPESLLNEADLIALRLVGLPGPEPTMWLVWGYGDLWDAVPDRCDDCVAGVLWTRERGRPRNLLTREHPLYRFWDENATKLEQVGAQEGVIELPNISFIGAEERIVSPLRGFDLFELATEPMFQFLAEYKPSAKKQGHLENSMSALLAVDPDRFGVIAADLHHVLPRIELLNRAHPKTRRPLVRLANGREVTLEHLSAGERAALITLFTIARWMTRGGVVLIDEPELHQHLSLMRSNLAVLESYVVDRMEGQLVVASHAPEVWDHFRVRRPIIDLDIPSGEGSA